MDNMKKDEYFISKMFDDLAFIIRHMEEIDAESFSNDELLQDSMLFRLIQISENARKLTEGFREDTIEIRRYTKKIRRNGTGTTQAGQAQHRYLTI